ncbi:MAG TPA: ABC transporter ATP-binding protein [Burkholderiaceae bacterium]|nr:ABC transporter ATP-binding protein [Burkholderiaceae bacterium]
MSDASSPGGCPSADIVLRATGLVKSFAGFVAVNDVDLAVRRGSIHALIGPNGAGKTTCFNLLTRFLAPTSGRIHFGDRDITRAGPAEVARRGLCRTFQISSIFPQHSVLQNVRLALQIRRRVSSAFWRSSRSLAALDGRADELLAMVGLTDVRDRPAGRLAYGQRRILELAITLALDPEVMLLDEPLAGVGREDIDRICDVIRMAVRTSTVVMVEHNLKAVSRLADTITVLARGRVIAEGDYRTVSADPQVRAAYIGDEGHEL